MGSCELLGLGRAEVWLQGSLGKKVEQRGLVLLGLAREGLGQEY